MNYEQRRILLNTVLDYGDARENLKQACITRLNHAGLGRYSQEDSNKEVSLWENRAEDCIQIIEDLLNSN